jgi:hypothetical protein
VRTLKDLIEDLAGQMREDVHAGRRALRLTFRGVVAAAASARAARPGAGPEERVLRRLLSCPCRLCLAARPDFVGAFAPGGSERLPSAAPGKVRTAFFALCKACAAAPDVEARLAEVLLRDGRLVPRAPADN